MASALRIRQEILITPEQWQGEWVLWSPLQLSLSGFRKPALDPWEWHLYTEGSLYGSSFFSKGKIESVLKDLQDSYPDKLRQIFL